MNFQQYKTLARRAYVRWREGGVGAVWAAFNRRFRESITKRNVFLDYDFVDGPEFGATYNELSAVPSDSINWVIPPFGIGSGGHLTIFRTISNLERLGFRNQRIIIVGRTDYSSGKEAHQAICKHFIPLEAKVYLGEACMPPATVTMATGWQTAYVVKRFRSTRHKCYFVQDFEPYFNAMGTDCILAENTYRFGFRGITAGDWLAQKLHDEYGMETTSFGFSYDKELFKPLPKRETKHRHIFFYARPVTPRRGFELGLLALRRVVERLPDVRVIFAGWDVSGYEIPFHHHNGGVVPVHELPDLYSQCDAALVVSLSNLSLMPVELMACGCPVVINKGPCNEWMVNETNAALVEPTVEAIADELVEVLTNPEKREHLIEGGFATAAATDWMAEAAKVGAVLEELIVDDQVGRQIKSLERLREFAETAERKFDDLREAKRAAN